MSYSKVDVANMGLRNLGKATISTLTENSTEGRAANFWFEKSASEALARSHWTFARKIQALASETNNWEERWSYMYDSPSDAISIVRIIPRVDPMNAQPEPHQLLGGKIYTNMSDAKAEFVFEQFDTTRWSTTFAKAVGFLMARDMALELTKKSALYDAMNSLYDAAVGRAIGHDAGQEPTFWAYESEYLVARNGGESLDTGGGSVDGSIYWE